MTDLDLDDNEFLLLVDCLVYQSQFSIFQTCKFQFEQIVIVVLYF